MGALMAGILIGRSSQMQWLEHNLKPFRVFFLSLFFQSIGLKLNVSFLSANIVLILFIVAIILLINSLINVFVFRLLKISWQNSFYAGASLSQIGEFSLVLSKVGKQTGLLNDYWFQLTLVVISLTMLLTSVWINIIRTFIFKRPSHVREMAAAFKSGLKKTRRITE
jgi:CPA2 family monovalent cation:H+ antiporter-2